MGRHQVADREERVERLPPHPLTVRELEVASGDVVRDDVALDERERVVHGDSAGAAPDHHAELRFVVDLLRDGRDADRITVADQGVRPLREEQRPLGQRDALFVGVVAVVQPDTDDLLRKREHGRAPTTPFSTAGGSEVGSLECRRRWLTRSRNYAYRGSRFSVEAGTAPPTSGTATWSSGCRTKRRPAPIASRSRSGTAPR